MKNLAVSRGDKSVLLGMIAIGLAILPQHVVGKDAQSMYAVAQAMSHGRLAVPCELGAAHEGACYSTYYPLQSVLSVPAVWLGGKLLGASTPLPQMLALILPLLASAFTVILIGRLGTSLGGTRRAGLLAGIAFLFTTEAFVYWRTFQAEMLAALFVTAAALWLPRQGRAHVLGAACLGFMVLAKPQLVFVAVPLAAAAAGWRWRALVAPAVALGFGSALCGLYNFVRFDSFTNFGGDQRRLHGDAASPGHLLEALGLLGVSPGRGMLIFSPVAVVGLILIITQRARFPVYARMTVAASLGALLIAALNPGVGFNWGTRYLLPVMPLMCAGLVVARGVWVKVAAACAAWGASIALPTVITNYGLAFHHSLTTGSMASSDYWSIRHGSIVYLWTNFSRQPFESWLPWWARGSTTASAASGLVAAAILLAGGWMLLRSWRASSRAD